MTSRDHARPVSIDVGLWLGSHGGDGDGIDVDQPAAGGLVRWIRTTGGWVGVVNVVLVLTDGSTIKFSEQLIPARALRPR